MSYHSGRDRRGFTLLELIVVMSIIAVMATMSMGKMTRMMTNWRLTRAAQAMTEELQASFALVGRNRKPLRIVMDKTKMELRLTDRSGTVIYRRRNFGSTSAYRLTAADMTVYPATTPTLEIYPPGLAADSLSIVISKSGQARRIRMLRGGLVQTCPTGATNKC